MFWYNLIEFWSENHTGLTIPFVVGAVRKRTDNEMYTINSLFSEMKNGDLEYNIIIRHCRVLNEYVLCIKKLSFGRRYNKVYGNIEIDSTCADLRFSNNIDDILDYLEAIYSVYTDSNKYSINNRIWTGFDNKDIQLIEHVSKV